MILIVRLARVLLTLVLALLVVSFLIGVVRPETGVSEKVVLVALMGVCVVLAAQLSIWSARAQTRIHRF